MRTLHLFAGAGGGLLADLILGHTPVCAVEWDAYCCRVLRERIADGWFPGLHVHEGDIRLFDPSDWTKRVDCIHAGFPCQDISAAGTGAGITGSRSGLVSEVFRAIDIIRPRYVFLENSPRIRTRGRHVVIGELVAHGYAWRDGKLAASDVGAPHKRERWWCLAADIDTMRELQPEGRKQNVRRWINHGAEKKNANAVRERSPNSSGGAAELARSTWRSADLGSRKITGTPTTPWFATEPDLERLVYGMADGMVPAAVKALGNGQVPLQAATAWKILMGEM